MLAASPSANFTNSILLKGSKSHICYRFYKMWSDLKSARAEELALAMKINSDRYKGQSGYQLVFETLANYKNIDSFRNDINEKAFQNSE